MARKYQSKQRAKTEAETRQRIVDATIHLHRTVGDAATTVSAIAERAGVGRVTVYRHFPDQRSLLTACTNHYFAINPPPDATRWAGIPDPEERLEMALGEMYAFYRRNEGMLARAEQDAGANPILAELLEPFGAYLAEIRGMLAAGRPDDPLVVAAIGHALAFGTWRTLTRDQGLGDAQAVSLMEALVRCAPAATRVEPRQVGDVSSPATTGAR